MKKRLLFTAYNLDLGGIEKALANLLNQFDYEKYEVTLILEKKEGIFLDIIPKEVTVLEYKISNHKCVLLRKIYNRMKLLYWKLKLHHKYDFSASFATYSIPGAHLALSASKNNALWMHGNYYITYERDEKKLAKFLDGVFADHFQTIVFVSEENRRDICMHYNKLKGNTVVCNNFINGEEILEKANEKCDYQRSEKPLFINVGRHEEYQKRLSRVIEASKRLKEEGYEFEILFVGDGPDSKKYEKQVQEYHLENVIKFLGSKKNPFPYYKLSDAVLLSSEYEGYPVVYVEAMILNKPILSTKISDYETLEGNNGIFCDCNVEGIYQIMKEFLEHGFEIKEPFDYQKFNQEIIQKIMNLIERN